MQMMRRADDSFLQALIEWHTEHVGAVTEVRAPSTRSEHKQAIRDFLMIQAVHDSADRGRYGSGEEWMLQKAFDGLAPFYRVDRVRPRLGNNRNNGKN